MMLDALLTPVNLAGGAALTTLAAGATGYSDVIDFSTDRDLGAGEMPALVLFTTVPTSATGGATINVAIQTSPDNATWTTLEETAPQPIANLVAGDAWAFRGWLNVGVRRYLRFAYTFSAALTAGAVIASIGADWPRSKPYPRNYTA